MRIFSRGKIKFLSIMIEIQSGEKGVFEDF